MGIENNPEMKAAIEAVEKQLKEAVGKYEGQVKEYGEATNKVRDEVKALSEEHAALVKEAPELKDRIKEIEQKLAEGAPQGKDKGKTWGEEMISSDALKAFKDGTTGRARVEVKNTVLGETGSPGEPSNVLVPEHRLPGIVPGAFRSLNILDFVPLGATSSNQITYTRETAFTNDAAGTSEGGQKPESDITFELVDDPVRTIAHFIKASKQILDDAPMLQSYINRRMEHGVRNKLQTQVLSGDGTAPNISGLSDTGRHTAFTPETGENALDSLNRAKYAIIGADYSPNFIFMNPADWGGIERLKRGTSDDAYIAAEGNGIAYLQGGMTPTVWGIPVVLSNDVTSGKFYMGDSNAFQLFMRQAAAVEIFEQDDTNVQKNLLTIRAELRAALAVYVTAAVRYGSLTI